MTVVKETCDDNTVDIVMPGVMEHYDDQVMQYCEDRCQGAL